MRVTEEDRAFCFKQIKRLETLPFYDRLTPEIGITDLALTLLAAADSRAQAELIISTWKATEGKLPSEADLWKVAKSLNAGHESAMAARPAPPSPCSKCADSPYPGMMRFTFRVKGGIFDGEERDAITECDCQLGRYLAAGTRRYMEERAAEEEQRKAEATRGIELERADPQELLQ